MGRLALPLHKGPARIPRSLWKTRRSVFWSFLRGAALPTSHCRCPRHTYRPDAWTRPLIWTSCLASLILVPMAVPWPPLDDVQRIDRQAIPNDENVANAKRLIAYRRQLRCALRRPGPRQAAPRRFRPKVRPPINIYARLDAMCACVFFGSDVQTLIQQNPNLVSDRSRSKPMFSIPHVRGYAPWFFGPLAAWFAPNRGTAALLLPVVIAPRPQRSRTPPTLRRRRPRRAGSVGGNREK